MKDLLGIIKLPLRSVSVLGNDVLGKFREGPFLLNSAVEEGDLLRTEDVQMLELEDLLEADFEGVNRHLERVSDDGLPDEFHVLVEVGDGDGHVLPVLDQTQVVHAGHREKEVKVRNSAVVLSSD